MVAPLKLACEELTDSPRSTPRLSNAATNARLSRAPQPRSIHSQAREATPLFPAASRQQPAGTKSVKAVDSRAGIGSASRTRPFSRVWE
jgi:hypothetical protein